MTKLLTDIYYKLDEVLAALTTLARRLGDLESELGRRR